MEVPAFLRLPSLLVGAVGFARGLSNFQGLPQDAKIPMQFGLFGEVNWSLELRAAYLTYPLLSAAVALGPTFCAMRRKSIAATASANVADEAVSFVTGLLLLAITEQVPRIVSKQQEELRPTGLVPGFLIALGGIGAAGAWAAKL